MRLPIPLTLALVVGLAACDRPSEKNPSETVYRALHGVLVYPRSVILQMEAGDSAGQVTLTTVDSLRGVTAWFRETFRLNHWTLQSDVTDRDSTVTLYAEQNGRPVWVRLHANVGGPGTTYTVIGGIVAGDTVK